MCFTPAAPGGIPPRVAPPPGPTGPLSLRLRLILNTISYYLVRPRLTCKRLQRQVYASAVVSGQPYRFQPYSTHTYHVTLGTVNMAGWHDRGCRYGRPQGGIR